MDGSNEMTLFVYGQHICLKIHNYGDHIDDPYRKIIEKKLKYNQQQDVKCLYMENQINYNE